MNTPHPPLRVDLSHRGRGKEKPYITFLNNLHQQALKEQQKRILYRETYDWEKQARPSQKIPPGDWRIWLILAGRGFGKTRTGAETLRSWVTQGIYKRACLLGQTFHDVRSVMVEGSSGLLSISPKEEELVYHVAKRQLSWPCGAVAHLYSAGSYEHLRGPQFDVAWIDEFAKFSKPQEVWDQLMLCLRLGTFPRVIITTTPRPLPFLKDFVKRQDVYVTMGHTFENAVNLSSAYVEYLEKNYAHTRLGQQELEGKILESDTNALWTLGLLEKCRLKDPLPSLARIVIAVDPSTTSNRHSDETGIIVAGKDQQGFLYVLDDLSGKMTPTQWAKKVIQAYKDYQADRVVAEVNNGGDLVEKVLRSYEAAISYTPVRATRGKILRAEPIAALYEQQKVFHCKAFPELEKQMTTYTTEQNTSPDRLDALVWALTDLTSAARKITARKIWNL